MEIKNYNRILIEKLRKYQPYQQTKLTSMNVLQVKKYYLTVCYYHVMYEFQSESTLYSLAECQGTPFLKQALYLKFKWQQLDLNPQALSSQPNTQPFSQGGQIIEPCCEYLSVRCIWLFLIIMSRTSSKNSFLEAGAISEV